jgi:hypothetical protein
MNFVKCFLVVSLVPYLAIVGNILALLLSFSLSYPYPSPSVFFDRLLAFLFCYYPQNDAVEDPVMYNLSLPSHSLSSPSFPPPLPSSPLPSLFFPHITFAVFLLQLVGPGGESEL